MTDRPPNNDSARSWPWRAARPLVARLRSHFALGFSYVESIFLMTTLSTGFVAIIWLTSEVGETNLEAREQATATLIGHNQMEALKLQGYRALEDLGPVDGTLGPLDATGASAPGGRYRVRWDIQTDPARPGLKRLQVVVSWTSHLGHEQQVTLETVLSNVVR